MIRTATNEADDAEDSHKRHISGFAHGSDCRFTINRIVDRTEAPVAHLSRRQVLGTGVAVAGGMALWSLAGCASEANSKGLDALRATLSGTLLLPTDPSFAEQNQPANDEFASITPIAIALCASPQDVAACVNWCRNEGIQPVIRGGGHSYAGFSTTQGLLIKTTPMNSVRVDEANQTVTIGAGALNKELLAHVVNTNFMVPIGTCLEVGFTGLVLGGGLGDNSRWAGVTADHLVSTDVVLANGQSVTANATQEADLFWAARGGAGGNFGVHTSHVVSLVEIPRRQIGAFELKFHGIQDCVSSFMAFDKIMHSAPDRLSGFLAITNLNRPANGTRGANKYPVATFCGSYIGPVDELRDLLRPLQHSGKAFHTEIVAQEFWQAQIDWLSVPKLPVHGLAETAHFTNQPLPAKVVDQLIRRVAAAPGGSPDAYCEVRLMCWTGGKVNTVAPDATAYVHRSSTGLLRPAIWWQPTSSPGLQREMQGWFSDTLRFITPFCQPSAFQNWPYRGLPDALTQYYGSNLPRLTQVKKAYDPNNLFHYEQSIPVASA